ncbi:hypothetical protein [Marinifilum flexuosum]|uniref:Phospholipase D-like protein n=1 Tax=Marinifilum flexuosum TaxID=1117708 RepID=A0A419XAE7_9BACT|nr:hypothetical protein [Marinifilum flexuosum]RKE04727.1 hypothetical protein BXY64_1754 [Marinifilum flexuosum]
MNIIYIILIGILHIFALIDAIKNASERNGAFRLLLAFFPPLLGPIIYYLTKKKSKREFMKGKRRYS